MRYFPGKSLIQGTLLLACGGYLFLCSCSAPPQGNIDEGKRWFGLHHCDGCHGSDGTGGKAPVIRGYAFTYNKLLNKLRKPDSNIMPSYPEDSLSNKQVADILSYLQ